MATTTYPKEVVPKENSNNLHRYLGPVMKVFRVTGFLPVLRNATLLCVRKSEEKTVFPYVIKFLHPCTLYVALLILGQLAEISLTQYMHGRYLQTDTAYQIIYVYSVRIKYICYGILGNFCLPRYFLFRISTLKRLCLSLQPFVSIFSSQAFQEMRRTLIYLLVFHSIWMICFVAITHHWVFQYSQYYESIHVGYFMYVLRFLNHTFSINFLILFTTVCLATSHSFQALTLELAQKISEENPRQLLAALSAARQKYRSLTEAIQTNSNLFHPVLFFYISAALLSGIVNLYGIVRCYFHSPQQLSKDYNIISSHMEWGLLLLIHDIFNLAVLTWAAELIPDAARKAPQLLQQIPLQELKLANFLNSFWLEMQLSRTEISSSGIFICSKRIFPAILGSVIIYMLVLLQFDRSTE